MTGTLDETQKQMIAARVARAEADTGLAVTWVRTSAQLQALLDNGLAQLYSAVFKNPPYEEDFSPADVASIFEDYLAGGGDIFAASDKNTGKVVAFIVSTPLSAAFCAAAGLTEYKSLENSAYYAEDGVDSTYRNNGVSAAMKALLLAVNGIKGRESLLVRTSIYNYPQIHGLTGKNGRVLAGIFQDVSSPRKDGTVKTDRRSFYELPTTVSAKTAETLDRVTIARPGGNDTAIVWDPVPRTNQVALSLRIQENYPGIEQVMFVEKTPDGGLYGRMAGGEFCGNATRSLAWLVAGGRNGPVSLSVSGIPDPVTAEIDGGNAKISIPNADKAAIRETPAGYNIIDLEGISFLLVGAGDRLGQDIAAASNVDGQKALAWKALHENGLDTKPAAGVLVISELGPGKYALDPFVYVRDTGTLFYETGCGSGSAAIGLFLAGRDGGQARVEIVQPSRMSLFVTASIDPSGSGTMVSVDGPVDILFDGRMNLPSQAAAQKPQGPN